MAVIRRIDRTDRPGTPALGVHLARLIALHSELAWAEVRGLLFRAALAVGVALISAMAAVAAIVVLIAACFAPLFGGAWPHLVVAGGGVLIAAALAIGWSAWRLRNLRLPRETVASLGENWEWLVAQVRSRLTLR
jgi:uncharacterized membrane protein YqjE